jgi:hypothetical protein
MQGLVGDVAVDDGHVTIIAGLFDAQRIIDPSHDVRAMLVNPVATAQDEPTAAACLDFF